MSRILDLSAPTCPKTRHTRQIGWQQRKRSNLMASRARGKLVHGIYFLNKAGHPQSRTRSVPSDPLSNHIYPIAISVFFLSLAWVFPSTLLIERHQDAQHDTRPIHSFIGRLGSRYLRDWAHYPPLRWSLGTLGWREKVLVEPMVALALRSSIFLRSISS